MSGKVPQKWLAFDPMGKVIEGTRFVPFKAPISARLNSALVKEKRFDLQMLLAEHPNLGIVIDLTDSPTNRLYSPSIIKEKGIEYVKIVVPGQKIPTKQIADRFNGVVLQFCRANEHNNKLIGVHCAHGVNRTGFLICHFMITNMNMDPDTAIDKFSDARGYGIERPYYIEALRKLKPSLFGQSKKISLNAIHSSLKDKMSPSASRAEGASPPNPEETKPNLIKEQMQAMVQRVVKKEKLLAAERESSATSAINKGKLHAVQKTIKEQKTNETEEKQVPSKSFRENKVHSEQKSQNAHHIAGPSTSAGKSGGDQNALKQHKLFGNKGNQDLPIQKGTKGQKSVSSESAKTPLKVVSERKPAMVQKAVQEKKLRISQGDKKAASAFKENKISVRKSPTPNPKKSETPSKPIQRPKIAA